jgi:PST family polysaccharide transporter/stage V sporulation protein B
VAAALNVIAVRRHTGVRIDWADAVGKPLLCSLIMGAAAFLGYAALMQIRGGNTATVAAVGIGIIAYLILLFATKTVTEAELALFPKGEGLVKMYRKALTLMRRNARI